RGGARVRQRGAHRAHERAVRAGGAHRQARPQALAGAGVRDATAAAPATAGVRAGQQLHPAQDHRPAGGADAAADGQRHRRGAVAAPAWPGAGPGHRVVPAHGPAAAGVHRRGAIALAPGGLRPPRLQSPPEGISARGVMTHEGFWQSILADPDSDTPRLVYADWLEEQGEAERAEFIRVQIELAKMSEDDPRCAELTARQTALLPFQLQALRLGNSPAWPRKMPRWALNSSPVFQRGFVEEIYCTAAQLIDGAEGLFRAAPVRVLGVRNARERVAALAQVPQLRQIVSLELDGQKLGWETTALWASPHLTRLRRRDLRGTPQRVAEARALAQGPGAR